jgi:hydrogenase/urease accessory protein HupE
MKSWAVCLCHFILLVGQVCAHEMRPGYLEIRETAPAAYELLWKLPVRGGRQLQLAPQLPDLCRPLAPAASYATAGAQVTRWTVRCDGGMAGQRVEIAGLDNTFTDVLARVEHLGGAVQTVRIKPGESAFTIQASPRVLSLSGTYLWLGIEHIWLGIDHLLFVFALLLIVSGWRRLAATITAFTVAHSITLASATLGWVQVPQQPVEAVIALSILFLATEIVHGLRGRPALTARQPWIVAFVFGLLHGFGFAGALVEVGLPQQAIPLALLFFNIGVEVGQLVFVAAVLALGQFVRRLGSLPLRQGQFAASYAIGGLAALWTFERIAGFWI